MRQTFEWQTDEEAGWDPPPLPPPVKKRRPYWILFLILFVLAVLGGVGYWQAQQRVNMVEAAIRTDVLSSHALFQQAAEQQDVELLRAVISGADASWLATQFRLLEMGLLTNRWVVGLQTSGLPTRDLATAVFQNDLLSVDIAPELTEAVVVWQQPFLSEWGSGEPVMLQQTAVYRQGEQRWLLAPFDDDFWGEWDTVSSQHLIATFASRDADIVQRLLNDLDETAAHLCQTLVLPNCQWRLRFSTDAQELANIAFAFGKYNVNSPLQLPTPTLIGLPADDAAYAQLLAGYRAHLAASLLNQQSAPFQEGNLFNYALLMRQLIELDYLPASLTTVDYHNRFLNPVAGLLGLGDFWLDNWAPQASALLPVSDGRMGQIQLLLDYLQSVDPEISWLELRQRLGRAEDYRRWLQKYVAVGSGFGGNREQERKWLRFVEAQFPQTAVSHPPTQDIQLLCSEGNGRRANLLRYDTVRDEWRVELTDRTLLFMAPLPDDSGVFLQERQARLDRSQGILWENDVEQPALRQPLNAGLFRVDPLDGDFLLYAFNFSESETAFSLMALDSCTADGCLAETFETLPAWSPNRRYSLYQEGGEFLYLNDRVDSQPRFISAGASPFWIDDETYGFVLPPNEDGKRVEHLMVTNLAKEVLAYRSLQLFLTAIPPQALLTTYTIKDVVVNPHNKAELLLAIVPLAEEESGAFVLGYNYLTRETRRLLTLSYELSPHEPLRFSPDERWLTVQSFAASDANWELHVYDLLDGQTAVLRSNYVYTLPGYDWSANGEWLLRVDDGFVHLFAPKQDVSRLLVHDYPRCNFAAWVERMPPN